MEPLGISLYPRAPPQVSFWRPFLLALHVSELQRLPTIGRKNEAPGLKARPLQKSSLTFSFAELFLLLLLLLLLLVVFGVIGGAELFHADYRGGR